MTVLIHQPLSLDVNRLLLIASIIRDFSRKGSQVILFNPPFASDDYEAFPTLYSAALDSCVHLQFHWDSQKFFSDPPNFDPRPNKGYLSLYDRFVADDSLIIVNDAEQFPSLCNCSNQQSRFPAMMSTVRHFGYHFHFITSFPSKLAANIRYWSPFYLYHTKQDASS